MSVTAHPTLEFKTPSGEVHKVEYRQFVLNEYQQIAALAIDKDEIPIETEDADGVEYKWIGKLPAQSVIFSSQIRNSLRIQEWDFESYPNPEILLITKIK
jgi:hypothetical protein